jgi:outer membrane lipoprotein SlyB
MVNPFRTTRFSHRSPGAALIVALLTVSVLGGCATPRPGPVAAAPGATRTGTIVSARTVMLQIGGAEGGVLGALGAPASAGETLAPATEFIVRETDGRVISVMQPQPTALHPGEAVAIVSGVTTRLSALPAQ